jgi:DNA-binding NarL/FixJ family response regulator
MVIAAIRAGVSALCIPDIAASDLINLVRACASGLNPINDLLFGRPGLAHLGHDQGASRASGPRSTGNVLSLLSAEETQVLRLRIQGLSTREIAARLGMRYATALRHAVTTMRKLRGHDNDPPTAGMPARRPPPQPSSDGHQAPFPLPDSESS